MTRPEPISEAEEKTKKFQASLAAYDKEETKRITERNARRDEAVAVRRAAFAAALEAGDYTAAAELAIF